MAVAVHSSAVAFCIGSELVAKGGLVGASEQSLEESLDHSLQQNETKQSLEGSKPVHCTAVKGNQTKLN